ncbi:hypothetical protein ACIQMR_36240 [Streptomyces sp. NPDC091376]|uniref:hypothetical protein n=1 Tax=Streptomyces sp. NPDC091376 TaxID=3365994 RepID=UPI0037F81DD4
MVRILKAVLPALVLVTVAGCSSSADTDEQRLSEQRKNYCMQLGTWQKARNAASSDTLDSSAAYDEVGGTAQDALVAMQPLRDETVGAGRTLGEATAAAMNAAEPEAEGLVVKYCADAGFETLTR